MSKAVTADAPCSAAPIASDAAARTQVGDALPAGETGLLQQVEQQVGIVLRGVYAVRSENSVAQVVICGRHFGAFQKRGAVRGWINAPNRPR